MRLHSAVTFALEAGLTLAASFPHVAECYTWKNVKTGAGGGFVPGIVFNTGTQGVAYARTDIGGAYRLNSDDSWTPLMDSATTSNWGIWGTDALASDAMDPNRVVVAAGMYTNSWDPNNCQMLRSTDKGNTWASTTLPFKCGGNMPGRGMGERLAIDPKNSKIVYFGARSGNGLWKSSDYGATWSKVNSFPNAGTYVANPSDTSGYGNDKQGLAWVTFDPTSTIVNGATSRIFVGVADKGTSVYVSNDAGNSWTAVAGQPTGYLPHKGKISPGEKMLYLAYSDTSGPYDGGAGYVYKYNIANGQWTNITPISAPTFGFSGLAVDVKKPGTIMVATLNEWWPDAQIWRSTNSGATWTVAWEWSSYPNMNKYYSWSNPTAPWITAMKTDMKTLGWMIESMEIDPFDSNHWLYGTGLTIYGGHDLTKWDLATGRNVTIQSLSNGIEETAVIGLTCPPGQPLLSVVGDIGGWRHDNLDVAPKTTHMTPLWGTTTSIDYAGQKSTNVVRIGSANDGTPQVALSYDGGKTWSLNYAAQAGVTGGQVAYSAQADTILWSTGGQGVKVSKYQAAFSNVQGLSNGALICADRVNNNNFYALSGGTVYRSTNSGATFAQSATVSGNGRDIIAHPSIAGDIWLTTDQGLFHSTDSGSTFTKVNGPTQGWHIALGKGSPYKYIYGFFTINNVTGFFKSTDKGATWTKISDNAHGFASPSGNPVAASQDVDGLVFIGTNGRGIFYGKP